jgi:colicin import membrane protein
MNLTKTNVGFAAALAGVLALAGCQRDRDDRQAQQAAPAQSAEQSAERAADQQERAADKAGEAAEAQREVQEQREELAETRGEAQEEIQEQKEELAEAQREARQEMTEAQQAQQQAEQQTGQAGQQMERADRQAGAQAQAGMGREQTASGELVRASDDEIVLRPEGGQQGELTLKVSDSTPVTIDGREGKISDLKEGTQVRASYEDAQGERTATRIEAQQQ